MEQLLRLILELEKVRGIPQFLYYYGIDGNGSIAVREQILKFKKAKKSNKAIDFILNSSGGSADDAYRIIRTLINNFETVNIIIPFWAKSAATLLSFGATSIIMDEFGEFGALDVQLPIQKDDSPYFDEAESALIDELSLETIENRAHQLFLKMFISIYTNKNIPISKNEIANDLFGYLSKFYEPVVKQINPYKIGDKKRKLDIGAQYANRILAEYNTITAEERRIFIDYLVNDCPDHGYIVDYDLISRFLPNVIQSSKISEDYSNKLAEVSLYLLKANHEKERFIGFVDGTLFEGTKEEKPIKKDEVESKSGETSMPEILKKEIKKKIKPNGEAKPV